jgi:hypothetical protein
MSTLPSIHNANPQNAPLTQKWMGKGSILKNDEQEKDQNEK